MLWSTTPRVITTITMEYSKPITLDKNNGRVSMNIKLNEKKIGNHLSIGSSVTLIWVSISLAFKNTFPWNGLLEHWLLYTMLLSLSVSIYLSVFVSDHCVLCCHYLTLDRACTILIVPIDCFSIHTIGFWSCILIFPCTRPHFNVSNIVSLEKFRNISEMSVPKRKRKLELRRIDQCFMPLNSTVWWSIP